MSESVDREQQIRDLLDQAQHRTDAAVHCVVEIEPGSFVVTRTREQAVRLRGALSVLRAHAAGAAKAAPPAATSEAPETSEVKDEPEGDDSQSPVTDDDHTLPPAPAKRGPGRPRKQTPAAPSGD